MALALLAPGALFAQFTPGEPLSYVARRFSLSEPQTLQGQIVMHGSLYALALAPGSRRLAFEGTLLWLNAPIEPRGNVWRISPTDVTGTIAPLLFPDQALKGRAIGPILLDPGHGGMDSGAVGIRRLEEKTAVLSIARAVQRRLRSCGLDALLTRERDIALSLQERVVCAERRRAGMLISIHLNSTPNSSATGVETYLLPAAGYASTHGTQADHRIYPGNRYDSSNLLLAFYLQRGLLHATGSEDRGVKRARFEVLRDAPCPAALVECAFLSNRKDESMLAGAEGREHIAEGIALGILTYAWRTESANIGTWH